MDCKQEACSECTERCLLVHRNRKHPVPNITSFFKVMIGDKFSEILFLPPKFARTVSALVDEKTHLEDLSGQQWQVTVSNLNGSLAFCQGWHAFAQDHHLEIGDFVIFHYCVGSHFIAQIYDRTGCEKPKCSENNQQKKTTSKRSPISKRHAAPNIVTGLINEQASSTSVLSGSDIELTESQSDTANGEKLPMIIENTSNSENSNVMLKSASKAEYIEEPLFILDKDLGFKQGGYESSIFHISNFEMQNNEFDAHGNKKIMAGDEKSPYHADELIFRQTEEVAANEDTVVEGRKVAAEARKVVASDASNIETIEKNKDSNMMGKIELRESKGSCDDRLSGKFLASSEEHGENGKDSSDLGIAGIKECQTTELRSNTHSTVVKGIKKEYALMTTERCGQAEIIGEIPGNASESVKGLHHYNSNPTDKIFKVAKTEEIELISSSLPIAAKLSCFAGNLSFLELPASLPLFSYRGRTKMEKKVVFLRDPEKRLWPVLYHEKPGLKVLTSGWEEFGRANNIQPGDECAFMLENEVEVIYIVHIIKK